MLPKGKQEIEAVSEDIKKNPNHISNIAVIGHTDPSGSDAYNNRLSQARANTVKQALAGSGLDSKLITAEGRGKKNWWSPTAVPSIRAISKPVKSAISPTVA